MSKIIALIVLLMMPLWAESLTVLNDVKGSNVFLNGVLIGQETITKHPVEAGEYIVIIKKGGNTLFKKSTIIGVGEDQVMDTNTFVGINEQSQVVDYGVKQVEEKRVKKATRGNFGLGASLSTFSSGVSFKFHPLNRIGLQTIGWASNGNDSDKYNIKGRIFYELEDTLLSIDKLAVLYVGAGIGKVSEEYGEPLTGGLTQTKTEAKDILEAFIGFEFSLASNFYWDIEFSLIYTDESTTSFAGSESTDTNFETLVALGGHIYFN